MDDRFATSTVRQLFCGEIPFVNRRYIIIIIIIIIISIIIINGRAIIITRRPILTSR